VPISWNIYNHKYPNKTSGIKGEASVKGAGFKYLRIRSFVCLG
jgi:hypothetical protein